MRSDIPHVKTSSTILEAAKAMNKMGATGAVVFQGDKAVGILTERSLLRKFILLNKKPDVTTAREVMGPLIRVSESASVEEVGRRLVDLRITRMGVFKEDDLLGWVTITDVARAESKKRGILGRASEIDEGSEVVCPNCKSGAFKPIIGAEGWVKEWRCDQCGYEQ